MNKDDILEKSRKENNNRDLYTESVYLSASAISSFVALLLTTIFFILNALINHVFNWGLYAIVVSIGAASFTVRATHTKRKRDIIFAIIYSVATLVLTVIYIYQLIATSAL